MKATRSNFTHDLTKAAVVAAMTGLAAGGSPTCAAGDDLTVTAKEMKEPGLSDPNNEAPTELYNMTVADFASMKVISNEGPRSCRDARTGVPSVRLEVLCDA
jgi:hypothetical protein